MGVGVKCRARVTLVGQEMDEVEQQTLHPSFL